MVIGDSGELKIAIRGEDEIVRAPQAARDLGRRLGFGMVDQSRIATAVSELNRNVIRYATNSQVDVIVWNVSGSHRFVSDRGIVVGTPEEHSPSNILRGNPADVVLRISDLKPGLSVTAGFDT